MTQIKIGNTESGDAIKADLSRLIDSRVLVQATSGAGKSWLLRLLCERCGKHVPLIVLDPEGEFSSLREKLDMILVGQGGEIPANPRTAAVLARRIAESRASAVIDIYDLELPKRREFVKQFLTATIDLPRSLWHPALYVLDEAHAYCPEKGSGEAASTQAVINLMTLGRKRGFCGMLATQRIAKLHKDAAAEAANVFTGRMNLDGDLKRACDSLGFGKSEWGTLKGLRDGEWFVAGPAFSPGLHRFRADQVETTHPRPGERHKLQPPAPSASVKRIVSEMQDLANRDPDEAVTLEEAQAIIARLKGEVRRASSKAPVADPRAIESAVATAERARDAHWKGQVAELNRSNVAMSDKLKRIHDLSVLNGASPKLTEISATKAAPTTRPAETPVSRPRANRVESESGQSLGRCAMAILQVLDQHGPSDSNRLTKLAGYTYSGNFVNNLGMLRTAGFISGPNAGVMEITDVGRAQGPFEPLPTGEALREYWLSHPSFGVCARAVLRRLIDVYPETQTKQQLCEATGYEYSGNFVNNLGSLRTAGLLEGKNTGEMRASSVLFEE